MIGSGVSGLSAAWLLSRQCKVSVFEADSRLGGHSNTIDIEIGGVTTAVDTGFIVFNTENYPNLTAWLECLGVPTRESCMSFGVSIGGGEIEYSGQSINSIFTRRKSLISKAHWMMLVEILRFHKLGRASLTEGISDSVPLSDFIERNKFRTSFIQNFLKPMAAAIWSSPANDILQYPAGNFFRFFDNHGLLQSLNLPSWRTVEEGAISYVRRVGCELSGKTYLNTPVRKVIRSDNLVELFGEKGSLGKFDKVIIATHADTALAMLDQPTQNENSILSSFAYQRNRAVVHFDQKIMPVYKRAWSSWNYLSGNDGESVTYWMNRLQNLESDRDIFVTLNPYKDISHDNFVASFDYTHPIFDIAAGKAQRKLWEIQDSGGVSFCGAYFGQGFHEDGLQAGLAVAEAIGGRKRPWQVANESGRIWINPALSETMK